MLTNNKKRSFVKLIALTLAALMVFSVCLTGCTDEDARLAADAAKDAADKAQSTADAAQTAADGKTTTEAVAAQIAEALKPYLKADAALSEADVDKKVADLKATIEASLKNYQAKGDYAAKADLANYLKTSDALTKKAVEDMLKNYQAKGDYATTANVNSVKADLTAALKGYASKDDVTAAVADFATKAEVTAAIESFAAFAKSEDLTALSEALSEAMGAALTMEQVTEAITNTLVGVATEAYVDDAIAAAKAEEREITTKEIADAIAKALADYDLKIEDRLAEMEKALTEKIESYFIGFEPKKVVELLGKVDKAMNAEDWAVATTMVTRILTKAGTLMDRVVGLSYTQARKEEINGYMAEMNGQKTGVVIFNTITSIYSENNANHEIGKYYDDAHNTNLLGKDKNGNQIEDIDVRVATARIMTDLTVFILRAATSAELAGIEAQIDKAIAVPSFAEDMNNWIAKLYNIGTYAAVQKPKNNGYENEKWPNADGWLYHSKNADETVQEVQVATYAEEAKYNEVRAELEHMIITYLFEAELFGDSVESGKMGNYKDHVVALWKYSKDNTVKYSWQIPGTHLGEVLKHPDGSEFNVTAMAQKVEDRKTAKPTAMGDNWSLVGYYTGLTANPLAANATIDTTTQAATCSSFDTVKARNWSATVIDTSINNNWGKKIKGFMDGNFFDPLIKVDICTEYGNNINQNLAIAKLMTQYTPGVKVDDSAAVTEDKSKVSAAITFLALDQMISDAKDANAKANTIFTGRPAGPADLPANSDGAGEDDYTAHKEFNLETNKDYFLWHIGHNYVKLHDTKADGSGTYVCNCSLYSHAWYVENLKDFMVEQTESEPFAPVDSSWQVKPATQTEPATTPVWLSPVINISGFVAPWNFRDSNINIQAQAKTVDVYFNYAHNINGVGYMPETYSAIEKYDLYEQLHRAAWEKLYAKYASYAGQVLNIMVNDFRVAALASTKGGVSYKAMDPTTGVVAFNGVNAGLYIAARDSAATDLNLKSTVMNAQWTDAFLQNYFNGTDNWKWTVGSLTGVEKQIGKTYSMEGLKKYYEYNKTPATYADYVDANGNYVYATVESDVIAALSKSWKDLDNMLVASVYGVRNAIGEATVKYAGGIDDATWATLKGKRVQEAFNDILEVAMLNLQEIMYRFMNTEINDAYINMAYDAVCEETVKNGVTGENEYTGGVANFFAYNDDDSIDTEDLAVLKHMMQVYVTGHGLGSAEQGYDKNVAYTPDQFGNINTSYTLAPKDEVPYSNSYMTVKVAPMAVYDLLITNVITPDQFIQLGETIERSATAALENAKKIYKEAVNTMANMAVQYRYHEHIQQAKNSAYFTYLGYVAVAKDYEQRTKLDHAYNVANSLLLLEEYYAKRGEYKQEEYLASLREKVLAVSIASTSNYYELFGAKGSSYTEKLLEIPKVKAMFVNDKIAAATAAIKGKTADDINAWSWQTKKTYFNDGAIADVVANGDNNKTVDCDADKWGGTLTFRIPKAPVNGADNYHATGSATAAYDAIVNP